MKLHEDEDVQQFVSNCTYPPDPLCAASGLGVVDGVCVCC